MDKQARLDKAVKQLRNASHNLFELAELGGGMKYRQASHLAIRLADALVHGSVYKLAGLAEALDEANGKEETPCDCPPYFE